MFYARKISRVKCVGDIAPSVAPEAHAVLHVDELLDRENVR